MKKLESDIIGDFLCASAGVILFLVGLFGSIGGIWFLTEKLLAIMGSPP